MVVCHIFANICNLGVFFPRPIRLLISRATIYFYFYFLLQTFCLTKAYNFCHQVALVDGLMRREVAIRWTNEKRAGAVWACAIQIDNAQKSKIFLECYSGVQCYPRKQGPLLNFSSLQKVHFEGRTISVGRPRPEIFSGERDYLSRRHRFKKEPLIAKQNCYTLVGHRHGTLN